jgi:exodeoxyribonuclease VII small subunit
MATKTPSDKKEVPFEESLARLETIVKEMESGKLTLDQMMAHFEEGSVLVKQCGDKLNEVEKKIEVLIKKGDELTTEPFEPEEG